MLLTNNLNTLDWTTVNCFLAIILIFLRYLIDDHLGDILVKINFKYFWACIFAKPATGAKILINSYFHIISSFFHNAAALFNLLSTYSLPLDTFLPKSNVKKRPKDGGVYDALNKEYNIGE
jgi:hypothetical protein